MATDIMPFKPTTPTTNASNSVSGAMMVSRQAQEVQAMAVLAKQFPRNESESWSRIMKTCQRQSLAERAMYEYPRGKEKVSGPSIRLAEAIAQNWGNIDSGFIELENKNGASTVMAFCWDLETNTRQSKVFTVPHMRTTKSGSYPLTDPRDIYELVANQAARRVRSCILSVIPGDIVDAAVAVCQQTLCGGEAHVHEKVQQMLDVFRNEFGIKQQAIERYIGCNASAFTAQTVLRLRGVYNAVKEGRASIADYFEAEAKATGKLHPANSAGSNQLPATDIKAEQPASHTEGGGQVKLSDL